jgi:hypothetical protein
VRQLLDTPTGTVSNETMGRATRDLFLADRATSIESFAQSRKAAAGSDNGDDDGDDAGSPGVVEVAGDVFCVGGLVASVAAFDACELGDECSGELTIDSCLLRVGEGDEDARGNIKLKLENVVEAAFERSTFGIDFDGWESTKDDGLLDAFAGTIALESTRAVDDSSVELVFASDLDVSVKRKQRDLFDDGIEEHTSFTAGLRFEASESDDATQGSLEVLAFADSDNGRDESIVVRLAAEGHRVDASNATAGATLEIIGENGTFACTWAAAESSANRDGLTVTSEGNCVDADGETFSFSGSAASD